MWATKDGPVLYPPTALTKSPLTQCSLDEPVTYINGDDPHLNELHFYEFTYFNKLTVCHMFEDSGASILLKLFSIHKLVSYSAQLVNYHRVGYTSSLRLSVSITPYKYRHKLIQLILSQTLAFSGPPLFSSLQRNHKKGL